MSEPSPDLHPDPILPETGGGCGGAALVAIGLVLLVPSGLCTVFLGFLALVMIDQNPDQFWHDLPNMTPIALGVIVVASFGTALVHAGRKLGKKP